MWLTNAVVRILPVPTWYSRGITKTIATARSDFGSVFGEGCQAEDCSLHDQPRSRGWHRDYPDPKSTVAIMAVALLVIAITTRLWGSTLGRTHAQPPELTGVSNESPSNQVLDIAESNLIYSDGLPGTEGLDSKRCLAVLDAWARHVAGETAKRYYHFTQSPDYYEHSEAKFKMIQLVLTLQQDFGVTYCPSKRSAPSEADLLDPSFFEDASMVFLCGVLTDPKRGTCASLPVLVAAIGRRLGYPLKLVATKGHLFVRWESSDGRERFNIEVAGEGLDFYPDSYYRNWPMKGSDVEIEQEGFLKSMTADEESAVFLELRGYCLEANHRYADASTSFERALQIRPGSVNLRRLVDHARSLSEHKRVEAE